ncbi:hypothetical protein ALC60_01906, partial [Trachymyrmex zeteki]
RPWRRLYKDLVSSKCLSRRRGNSSVPATIELMVKLLFTSLIQNLFEIGYEVGFTREWDNTKAVSRLRYIEPIDIRVDKYETTFCANMRAVKRGTTSACVFYECQLYVKPQKTYVRVLRPCEHGPSRDGPKGVNARVTLTEFAIRNRCGDVAWALQNESFALSCAASASVERLPSVAFYLPHVDDKRARHCRSNRPRRENEDPGPRWERETTAHEY